MILIAHIIFAIASIALTAFALFRPTKLKLYGCYSLATGTLASGTFLIMNTSANLVRACIAGLTYFAIVSIGIAVVRHKARQLTLAK